MSSAVSTFQYPSPSPWILSFLSNQKIKIFGISEDRKHYSVDVRVHWIIVFFHVINLNLSLNQSQINNVRGLIPVINAIKTVSHMKSYSKKYELNYEIEDGIFKTKDPITLPQTTTPVSVEISSTATDSSSVASQEIDKTTASHAPTLSVVTESTPLSSASSSESVNSNVDTSDDTSVDASVYASVNTTQDQLVTSSTVAQLKEKSKETKESSESETFAIAEPAVSKHITSTPTVDDKFDLSFIESPSIALKSDYETLPPPPNPTKSLASPALASENLQLNDTLETLSDLTASFALPASSEPHYTPSVHINKPEASIAIDSSSSIVSETVDKLEISSSTKLDTSSQDLQEEIKPFIFPSVEDSFVSTVTGVSLSITVDQQPASEPTQVLSSFSSASVVQTTDTTNDTTNDLKTESTFEHSTEIVVEQVKPTLSADTTIAASQEFKPLEPEPESAPLATEQVSPQTETVAAETKHPKSKDTNVPQELPVKSYDPILPVDQEKVKIVDTNTVKVNLDPPPAAPLAEKPPSASPLDSFDALDPENHHLPSPVHIDQEHHFEIDNESDRIISDPFQDTINQSKSIDSSLHHLHRQHDDDSANSIHHQETLPTFNKADPLHVKPNLKSSEERNVASRVLDSGESIISTPINHFGDSIEKDSLGNHLPLPDQEQKMVSNESNAFVEMLKPPLDFILYLLPESVSTSLRRYLGLSPHLVVFVALISILWILMHSIELFYHYSSKETALKNELCSFQSKLFKLKTERDQLRHALHSERERFSQIEYQAKEQGENSVLSEKKSHQLQLEKNKLNESLQKMEKEIAQQETQLVADSHTIIALREEVRRKRNIHVFHFIPQFFIYFFYSPDFKTRRRMSTILSTKVGIDGSSF